MNSFSYLDFGASEERGEDAKREFISGTTLVGDILKSTLGPKGMVKLLTTGKEITVTNDGATILKNLIINSASAKLIINSSVSQDWEEGDGTTTIAVLTSLILEECRKLKIAPINIIKGLELGLDKCIETLDKISETCKEEDLLSLAKTTLCSKVVRCDLDKFGKLCVDAVQRIKGYSLDRINFVKVAGRLEDSYLEEGFILDRDQDINLQNPKIMIANCTLDADKVKIFSAKIKVNSIKDLSDLEKAEKDRMKAKIEKMCSYNIDCFINRQLIYDYPSQLFNENGVVPLEHADFDGVERLASVLGGKIVSTFDGLDDNSFGTCKEVKNITIGNKKMVQFSGLKSGACTIVLKGSSKEVLDEAERSIHDALCVLKRISTTNKIIYGGGAPEMNMANNLNQYALKIEDKESSAVFALSNALERIPQILAENGGLDGEAIKSKLRSLHTKGKITFGVDFDAKDLTCMKTKGVVESLRIKKRIMRAAVETAQMLIKCDAIIKCKPRERTRH
ncbi:T complex protein 1 subunit beta [Spraguea lophii 42_110]|uniref:T complex protein 1 subunit beta n=1 Tax=Spraguea lophii (strain 42_110) TaxID=1358809 RepID=S7W4U1_SPRLO|nr:T complex protein 1 subunit beta [Spraguea lophii 42_110]